MQSILIALLALSSRAVAQNFSTKRGIVYVKPPVARDDQYWTDKTTDLTWYYNYAVSPSTVLDGSNLEFVPMQWGLMENPSINMTFFEGVQQLQKSRTVRYALGFNEPDVCFNGSACVDADQAALSWITQFEPMRNRLNITLGGPAVTNRPDGWEWLRAFHSACARIKQNDTGCEMDFLPIHFYGTYANFTAHIARVQSTYSNISSYWVTEFNADHEDLADSQTFYNGTTDLLDKDEKIARYALFGAFRSNASNVGPNGAMLDSRGQLTDIGSWYLGRSATGNVPSAAAPTMSHVHNSGLAIVVAASLWLML